MRDRTPWTQKPDTGPIRLGRKTYKNLVEFTRPCATCAEEFSIFVTAVVADGRSDSNSFGLINCEKHRKSKLIHADVETLMANNTMKQELEGLYARNKELTERLAKYELQPAMAGLGLLQEKVRMGDVALAKVIGCEPVQNTTNSVLPKQFPWA